MQNTCQEIGMKGIYFLLGAVLVAGCGNNQGDEQMGNPDRVAKAKALREKALAEQSDTLEDK